MVPEWTRSGHELDHDREQFTVSAEGVVVLPKDYRFN